MLLLASKLSEKTLSNQLLKYFAKLQMDQEVRETNHILTKLTNPNHDERHKLYHHLMTTLHDSEDDYHSGSRNVTHQQQSS